MYPLNIIIIHNVEICAFYILDSSFCWNFPKFSAYESHLFLGLCMLLTQGGLIRLLAQIFFFDDLNNKKARKVWSQQSDNFSLFLYCRYFWNYNISSPPLSLQATPTHFNLISFKSVASFSLVLSPGWRLHELPLSILAYLLGSFLSFA